ncbi:hypothetical protein [Thiopseudomonas alkaliphila]|uniref:PA0061/PA0062 family lipoprotein n=1 Tax=Thiopseudomonas alkaliphila TaxID=1697053 RepID=UPI0025791573|nr:hypothetical protein [Thiopseudomonas alkaliphila]MDM1708097.1 hypothetical protein [Thiopseudomonas alkaliphila]
MKKISILGWLCSVLALNACAEPVPEHDPQLAWIDVVSAPGVRVAAMRLNNQILRDARYFQVAPGAQRLTVRISYDRGGQGMDSQRRCDAVLEYDAFMAGERYQIKARANGWFVSAWLEDAAGQRLKNFNKAECGK